MASVETSDLSLRPSGDEVALAQDALPAPASELLARLAERPWAEGFYLAGSAALALYLGHRRVGNLDLMAEAQKLQPPQRRDLLEDLLQIDPRARVETARDGFLYLRMGEGLALRLFYYPYPLIDPPAGRPGLAVASPVDLGLMKLGAIISRGTRRDFVDLYLLCGPESGLVSLAELLERSQEKFSYVRDFPLQALKGLADRSLTVGEPMPRLKGADSVDPLSWIAVEAWLDDQVQRLGRIHVGLSPQHAGDITDG